MQDRTIGLDEKNLIRRCGQTIYHFKRSEVKDMTTKQNDDAIVVDLNRDSNGYNKVYKVYRYTYTSHSYCTTRTFTQALMERTAKCVRSDEYSYLRKIKMAEDDTVEIYGRQTPWLRHNVKECLVIDKNGQMIQVPKGTEYIIDRKSEVREYLEKQKAEECKTPSETEDKPVNVSKDTNTVTIDTNGCRITISMNPSDSHASAGTFERKN